VIHARGRRLVAGAIGFVALAGCAETTVDPVDTTVPGATSTTIPTGPPDVVLARLLTEVGGLSERVVENDGDNEALARIEALWAIVGPDVDATRPDLAPSFGAALDLVRRSVERRRPADADKAANNLRALIEAYET
jgi:hypothetical protein